MQTTTQSIDDKSYYLKATVTSNCRIAVDISAKEIKQNLNKLIQ